MHDYENFRYITEKGEVILLSKKENQVLRLLIKSAEIVTKEMLSEELYGVPIDNSIHDSIRSLMRILRKKLGITIKNKKGVGYYIVK